MVWHRYERRQISWPMTVATAVKVGSFKIYACKNCHLRLRGHVAGSGSLLIGCQWPDGFHRPTQLVIRSGSQLFVNGEFRIYEGAAIWVNQGATLSLGEGYINSCLKMSVFESVSIGTDVAIAQNVTIRDHDNHWLWDRPGTAQPIAIGNHVWIGTNVTILKGVTISDGAVVGAGSVVTRNVPEGMLVAGVPARPLRPVKWS